MVYFSIIIWISFHRDKLLSRLLEIDKKCKRTRKSFPIVWRFLGNTPILESKNLSPIWTLAGKWTRNILWRFLLSFRVQEHRAKFDAFERQINVKAALRMQLDWKARRGGDKMSNLMTGASNLHKISGWTFIQIHPVKDGRERVEQNSNYDR